MAEPQAKTGVCPVCGKSVDALRAGAVGIYGGTFVYFCSDSCRATFGGRGSSAPPSAAEPPSAPVARPSAPSVPAPSAARSSVPSTPPPPVARASAPPAPVPPFARPSAPSVPAAAVPEGAAAAAADWSGPADDAAGTVGAELPDAAPEDGEEVAPDKLVLPAYGLQREPTPRAGFTPAALFVFLLLLGVFAAAHLARRWFTWVDLPGWLGDVAAATGAGLLLLLGFLDLALRRGRGVDHLIVGGCSAALVLWSLLGGSAVGTPQALAVLAVYCAAAVAERRWLAQRPAPLAPVQGGQRPDALVDWGGPRGPLVRGLRVMLTVFPLLPLAAAIAAAVWAGLSGVFEAGDTLVPILVGAALAFLPWSMRHAGLAVGELARAASAANMRYLDPSAVERAAKVHHLVFLYRGVVTEGRPEVVEFVNYSEQPDAVIFDLVASAEQAAGGSSLAAALLAFTQGRGAVGEATTRLSRFWPGHGVKATSARGEVWIGSRRMMLEEGISTAPVEDEARHLEQSGHTVLFIAIKRRVHALVALADPVRAEMAEAADRAHGLGLETHLLTGESRLTAEWVARSARVRHIRPELTREERAAEIQGLREMGAPVGVVGRPAEPAQVIQEADLAVAIGVADPHGYPCEIAAAADDPRAAVAGIAAARRAASALVVHVVVAGAVALLNAGFSALGFLPPPATVAIVAALGLTPLLRRRRFEFGGGGR
ncbi:MAG: HAD family hydrolase [Deltaproteobacteria bacterium]|nr:HAD family hydrolase [Deltaproteobacteria bacterium]